jgi:hypothetical protein
MATKMMIALVLAGAGCKGKDSPRPAPVSSAGSGLATAGAAASKAPTIALAAGESFTPAADLVATGPNPTTWSATPTDPVALGFAFKGETARVLASVSGGAPIQLGAVEFDAAYSGSYGVTINKVGVAVLVITSSGGSSDPGFTAAWRLVWDAEAKQPVVDEKGTWPGDVDKLPDWVKLPVAM